MNNINIFYFVENETLNVFLKNPENYFANFYKLKSYSFKCTVINVSKKITPSSPDKHLSIILSG